MTVMTRIFLVRHGVTQYNVEGKFQGSQDIPLNFIGLRQAALLGQRFADMQISSVYSSPLLRAMQTAEQIAQPHGIAVTPVAELREIYAGKFEGRSVAENRRDYPEQFHNMKYSYVKFNPPEGESFRHLYSRVADAFHQILQQERDRTAIIVTHFFPASVITICAEGADIEDTKLISTLNASVSLFESDGENGLHTIYTGDVTHLSLPDGSNLIFEAGASFAI